MPNTRTAGFRGSFLPHELQSASLLLGKIARAKTTAAAVPAKLIGVLQLHPTGNNCASLHDSAHRKTRAARAAGRGP
jgi:hypothetical protein